MAGAPPQIPRFSTSPSNHGGNYPTGANHLVQMFGLITGALSGVCGGFMAVCLGLALWKTRHPHHLSPRLSAQRSVRTCHGLLCAAGACDVFYFVGVLIHQPFLPYDMLDSEVLCQIQGAVIDAFLLASACCLCALAHEVWYVHTSLLDTLQRGMLTPDAEWEARRKRSIFYAILVVLVPSVAVIINQSTAGYGTRGSAANEAWCWIKQPESKIVNDFFGFFVWIWACGLISLGFNLVTAYRLRAASVMQIHATDSQDTRVFKQRARRKALGMTSYPFIFIIVWLPGSIRHFTQIDSVWLEVMHFAAVGALGCFQLSAWLALNRTVRRILWGKVDDLLHCRCGEKKRSRSSLTDMGSSSIAEGQYQDALLHSGMGIGSRVGSRDGEYGSVDFSSIEGEDMSLDEEELY